MRRRKLTLSYMGGEAVEFARQLVLQRFPSARAAWLGGSFAAGTATGGSDLDITVLLDGEPAPYRFSVVVNGQPVELFVQTERSLSDFCRDDRARRRPTTMRLVGSSIVLVDRDGSGQRLQKQLHQMDLDGPDFVDPSTLEAMRYSVSDLLEDLASSPSPNEALVVGAALLRETADLLLAMHRRWSGSGKWLLRELTALDTAQGNSYAERLLDGLRATASGDPKCLHANVLSILNACGGTRFEGYLRGGPQAVRVVTASVDDDAEVIKPLLAAAIGGDQHRVDQVTAHYGHDDPSSVLLRAEIAGETVGVVGYTVRDADVVILHIATRSDLRRFGIGRRMLDAVRVAEPGHRRVSAETDSDAVGFYLANGFSAESLGEKYPGVERFHVHTRNTG